MTYKYKSVTITAPARLHMGFMDMNGDLGRNFGSLGLTLSDISTSLTVSAADDCQVSGLVQGKAETYAKTILDNLGLPHKINIEIHHAIPQHIGLGSGTQMALAISSGIATLFDLDVNASELANITERGKRSGIGLGAFVKGGFLVDGGRGENTLVPPVISDIPFPDEWRVMLIFDDSRSGLNGSPETSAFKKLPPMDKDLSGHLCRLVLMQILPALIEKDIAHFGDGITGIQEAVGDHFSRYQGGRYSSPDVADLLSWLDTQGVCGLGQSSWGPTGFALFGSEQEAQRIKDAAEQIWQPGGPIRLMLCAAKNDGAEVIVNDDKKKSTA